MLSWIIVIVALAIFQIIAIVRSFPQTYIDISTVLMIVGVLGLFYKLYRKKMVKMDKEIEEKTNGNE